MFSECVECIGLFSVCVWLLRVCVEFSQSECILECVWCVLGVFSVAVLAVYLRCVQGVCGMFAECVWAVFQWAKDVFRVCVRCVHSVFIFGVCLVCIKGCSLQLK